MATLEELLAMRAALVAARSSGTLETEFHSGGTRRRVVYRSMAEITTAIDAIDRDIASLAGTKPNQAKAGKLSYEMKTQGGNVRLKYLNPKESGSGVVAKPFGKATMYPGAFMTGGAVGNRKVVPRFKGHVMVRTKGRFYTNARSGVFIPVEMTQGATLAAFEKVAGPLLEQRVTKVIAKLLQ